MAETVEIDLKTADAELEGEITLISRPYMRL